MSFSDRDQKRVSLLPSSVPLPQTEQSGSKAGRLVKSCLKYGVALPLCALVAGDMLYNMGSALLNGDEQEWRCEQADLISPQKNEQLWSSLGDTFDTESFETRAIDWLSGAVQVKTESYDSMPPVGQDSRWEAFGPFHDYLVKAYPAVHASLKLTKVNTYGLLYEWTGTSADLKPILMAAHQDVVPVEPKTVAEWTHPPYSGYYDGQRIWGRGSSDDKSGLIGILSSVELLLESGFKPTRTVVIAFGFDEEASGLQGAAKLGEAMLDIYGEDAFAFTIDEGGGFAVDYGTVFATPAVAEKGYLDTRVEVATAGGHSSIPPEHTSIGILSALITHMEKHPYPIQLTRDNPMYDTLVCYGMHASDMSIALRTAITTSLKSSIGLYLLEKIVLRERTLKAAIGTTQAVDLIGGGVKVNALPEEAWAVVNHRISAVSSVEDAILYDTKRLIPLARHFNLSFNAFGVDVTDPDVPSAGTLKLSDAYDNALVPAPRTPVKGSESIPYQLLSGTIKATYNAHRNISGDNIAVAPGMSTGNTDTRYYWPLSKHIFRYNHKNSAYGKDRLNGVHTVNEYIEVGAFLEMIRFFTTLILNSDESTVI